MGLKIAIYIVGGILLVVLVVGGYYAWSARNADQCDEDGNPFYRSDL
jgi:heme/copper-type cytochrome/quinol oxidase subunit 2